MVGRFGSLDDRPPAFDCLLSLRCQVKARVGKAAQVDHKHVWAQRPERGVAAAAAARATAVNLMTCPSLRALRSESGSPPLIVILAGRAQVSHFERELHTPRSILQPGAMFMPSPFAGAFVPFGQARNAGAHAVRRSHREVDEAFAHCAKCSMTLRTQLGDLVQVRLAQSACI